VTPAPTPGKHDAARGSSTPANQPSQPGFARRAAEALKKAVWRSDSPDAPSANGVATVATLSDRVKKYLPSSDVQKVKDAFRFSDEAHLGQFRRSGAPYITHPLAVAEILTDWRLDGSAIQAALLHDVLEDSGIPKQQLVEKFGAVVAELVDGVSKLDKLQFSSTEQAQAENFRKMLLAMARDVRVMLIKLADRLHNMRTSTPSSPKSGVASPAKRWRSTRRSRIAWDSTTCSANSRN